MSAESFSRYEVYTTVQSIYCYPDSDVLKNKLNIRNREELKAAEEEFVAVKQMLLLQQPLRGHFTKNHLMRIHRFLFGEVYPFAGRFRREQISKGNTMFCPPTLIGREMDRVSFMIRESGFLRERDREKQIRNLSRVMSALNLIHPFREGNGRSIREFVRCMALGYGISLNWGNVERDTLLHAAVASLEDELAFCAVLEQCREQEIITESTFRRNDI